MERVCFNEHHTMAGVRKIKAQLIESLKGAVTEAGISEGGFVALIRTNIASGHADKAWKALFAFDYDWTLTREGKSPPPLPDSIVAAASAASEEAKS